MTEVRAAVVKGSAGVLLIEKQTVEDRRGEHTYFGNP
jgi:hypothetical protein